MEEQTVARARAGSLRRLHTAAAVAALTAVLSLHASAQTPAQPPPEDSVATFRTGVSLVRVDLQAVDSAGRDLPGLKADDLLVTDEGERKQITNFSRETDPLDVVLVIDVSGSMFKQLSELTRSASTALGQLRPGDRAALLLFASRNEVVQPFTSDFKLIEKKLLGSMYKQTLGRGTVLNEAVAAAARYLNKNSEPKTHRAIVVITDNEVERGSVTDVQLKRLVSDADAVLSAIIIGDNETPSIPRYTDPSANGPLDVNRLAANSGGRAVTTAKVSDALAGVISQLRTRYNIEYAGSGDSEPNQYRRIRVELSPAARKRFPGATVRAREGYYTSSPAK